jgi:hypothetical protein
MQRYLGSITASEAENQFALLRYTKEQCAHYPLASAARLGHRLASTKLAIWRNARKGAISFRLALRQGRISTPRRILRPRQWQLKLTDAASSRWSRKTSARHKKCSNAASTQKAGRIT